MSKNDINVLVVEDDKMVVEVLVGFLERFKKIRVIDDSESLEKSKKLLANEEIDLVLLDLFLIDGNGLDLLKWIRLNEIDVDIILITADKDIESIKVAKKYGVKDYLVKPFNYKRFEKAIKKYMKDLSHLNALKSLDQESIDRIMQVDSTEEVEGLNRTYENILNYLKVNYPKAFTSSELANILGISRITARRYLENMEDLKTVRLELDYGGVGRPKNKYTYIKK